MLIPNYVIESSLRNIFFDNLIMIFTGMGQGMPMNMTQNVRQIGMQPNMQQNMQNQWNQQSMRNVVLEKNSFLIGFKSVI